MKPSSVRTLISMPVFAYLFERFPAFTQTFCYREATEMVRQTGGLPIFSIRSREGEVTLPPEVQDQIIYLPEGQALKDEVWAAWKARQLPRRAKIIFDAQNEADWHRALEALWIGQQLLKRGIPHIHAHFAGMASRVAYWINYFYGISYSFTGHANDIFEERPFKITLRDMIREAAFVATETNFSRDWLAERYPDFAFKIHRVYNGISVAPLLPRTTRNERPHLLSVGRLVEKKGFPHLVEALGLLRKRGVEFQCTIVGDGPLKETLTAEIARLQLADRVRLTGALPYHEVSQLFKTADCFTLACVPEVNLGNGGMDNQPTVIAEAMLHGLPVVSTRLAGIPEMVEHGTTGFLLEECTAEALANALQQLIEQPEMAQKMGEAGYRLLTERFAVATTTRGLLELIERYRARQVPTLYCLSVLELALFYIELNIRKAQKSLSKRRNKATQLEGSAV